MVETSLAQTISDALIRAVKSATGEAANAVVEVPKDTSKGDYASNIAMQLSGKLKKSPLDIANQIVEKLELGDIAEVSVVAPGFINFKILPQVYWTSFLKLVSVPSEIEKNTLWAGKKVMIEFAHPNPFKAFHIGHLRNIILGESLVRLFEASGAQVIRTNYQGDVGLHIAKCLWAFKDVDPNEYPDSPREKAKLLGELYAKGATAYKDDEAAMAEIREINKQIYSGKDPEITKLWKLGRTWSLEHFSEIYKRVYSRFDREYMESEVMDDGLRYAKEALKKGILEESEGAIIFNGKKYGLDTRVFINKEGLPTYEGKELGLAFREFTDFGTLDLCIHNVAVEQVSFFKVTFKVQELLDPELFSGKQYHNPYEFVGLKKGKMSSRLGNVVLGMDILDEAVSRVKSEAVGVGAIKYSFLKISPFTYLAFDMDESVSFDGNSGPYLQYSYVRASSVLEKAGAKESAAVLDVKQLPTDAVLAPEELELVKAFTQFNSVVKNATETYNPSYVADYLYRLSQLFSRFYENLPILKEQAADKKALRLTLVSMFATVMKKGLYLLGIETVEEM